MSTVSACDSNEQGSAASRAPSVAAIEEACQERRDKEDALHFAHDKLKKIYTVLDYVTDDLEHGIRDDQLPADIRLKIRDGFRLTLQGGSALFDALQEIERQLPGDPDDEEAPIVGTIDRLGRVSQ